MAAADSIKGDLFHKSVSLYCPSRVFAWSYPDVTSRKHLAGDWVSETYLVVDESLKAVPARHL